MDNRIQFLTSLRTYAYRRLSDQQANALTDEINAHLDAAIQARIELGDTPAEAERSAVHAFGSPKVVVNRLAKLETPKAKLHVPSLIAMMAGELFLAVLSMVVVPGFHSAWIDHIGVAFAVFAVIGCFVTGWRATRFQWKGFAFATFASMFLWSLMWSTQYTSVRFSTQPELNEHILRADIDERIGGTQSFSSRIQDNLKIFQNNRSAYLSGTSDLAPKPKGAFNTWDPKYIAIPNRTEGIRAWQHRDSVPKFLRLLIKDQAQQATILAKAKSRPFYVQFFYEPYTLISYGFLQTVFFWFALNSIGVFCGQLSRVIQKALRNRRIRQ